MTTTQINPPFDGSAPCPMCAEGARGLSAYAYNLLNRWREGDALPESKFWSKLGDLRRSAAGEPGFQNLTGRGSPIKALIEAETNADVKAHLEAIDNLVRCFSDALAFDPKAQPSDIAPTLKPMVDRLRVTERPYNALLEAHFDDSRHASGQPNVLRAQRGYAAGRGAKIDGEYNFDVSVVVGIKGEELIYDLKHNVCGARLVIHEHFKERIKRDPAWYGSAWCPVCKVNAPWAQFECRVTA